MFLPIAFGILLVLAFPNQISAKSVDGIVISPAYVDLALTKPGETAQIEITITNNTNQSISLLLSALDFRQKGTDGSLSFTGLDSTTYSYTLASFLSFSENTIELIPGTSEKVTVYVTNRDDLSPGGHYAAVVAALAQDADTFSPQVLPSLSSLFFIRKTGGERFNISLLETSWPKGLFSLTLPNRIDMLFQNEGNIHLIPYGRIEVRDITGKLLADGTVNPSSSIILPESRRKIEAVMTRLAHSILPVNLISVTFTGSDSLKKTHYLAKDVILLVHPVFLVGLCVVLLIVALLIILRIRSNSLRRNR